MFIILLFIFLLILIIVNIILISKDNILVNKKLVFGDNKKLVFSDGNKKLVFSDDNKKLVFSDDNKKLVFSDGNKKLVFGGNKDSKTSKDENTSKGRNHPSGWQLYTLENCIHCDKQMEKLGGFNTYIKYKENGNDILLNNIEGKLYSGSIDGFPFWYNSITGETKYGGQEIDTLLGI